MKRNVLVMITMTASLFFLSGCIDRPDAQGWRPSQKEALLNIAQNDPYFSLCDAKSLYEEAKATRSSRLMNELLVRYAENLANGCIDIEAFERAQKARKNDDFHTHYAFYFQKVNRGVLLSQVRSGKPIENILKPYIPKYREFHRLIKAYHTQKTAGASSNILHKIRLNIERVKLMKPLEGDKYALINIPEFKVRIVEGNRTAVAMRVVVGKRHMQTPVFGENLQYIVLNPPWNVPESIIRKELLPKIQKSPNYLKKHGMEVHRNYNLDSPCIDLNDFDLNDFIIRKNATKEEKEKLKPLPFRIVQIPSKKNGLGRVKFLFPNRHSVYMHDTQSKYLFKRKVRTFSHGCIRLEKPKTMLRYLIEHYTDTPWEEAKKMYDSMETHFIRVTKPLPVHTAYFTVYVDDDGKLKSFNDIYGYDRIQHLRM
jgi:hypothetical protein